MKHISPSVRETAFNCPHCGVLAQQHWGGIFLNFLNAKTPLPKILTEDDRSEYIDGFSSDEEERNLMTKWFEEMIAGLPIIDTAPNAVYLNKYLSNVNASFCFNCDMVSIWVYDKLVYPATGDVVSANPDMPADIKRDYEEASLILHHSPRGAAALLRLAIQKLCKELGGAGKNINEDIQALVAGGLNVRVQQALDTVRVIGNFAVHPGQLDIKDDRKTAESLFALVNLIVDKMISEPKHVQSMYDSLPVNLVQAIEARDKK